MADWMFLVLGMLFVACLWDIGRRVSDRLIIKALEPRVKALEESLGDVAELREQVAGLDRSVTGVKNGLESQKARARSGFGQR